MDVLTVAGEAGYTHMNLTDGKYYQGYATSLAPGSNPGGDPLTSINHTPIQGQATQDSWGYRVTARMDFLDSFFQTNISPRVTFSHDVSGVSATFNENVKALSYGLGTTFKQDWALDLSYTDFFGGRTFRYVSAPGTYPPGQPAETATSSNSLKDRDIVSIKILKNVGLKISPSRGTRATKKTLAPPNAFRSGKNVRMKGWVRGTKFSRGAFTRTPRAETPSRRVKREKIHRPRLR